MKKSHRILLRVGVYACLLGLVSCTEDVAAGDMLTGTWKSETESATGVATNGSILQFTSGNKGTKCLKNNGAYQWSDEFRYQLNDSNLVIIEGYGSDERVSRYEYDLKAGKLTLTNVVLGSSSVIYIKQ